jgi:hypothetical protein
MRRRRMIRDQWYAVVIKSKKVNGACRLLLAHVAAAHMEPGGLIAHQDENGRWRAPTQYQLADELGWRRQRVNDRYAEAVKAGLLSKHSGGYNGCPTIYKAEVPDDDKGTKATPFRVIQCPGEQVPADRVTETAPGGHPVTQPQGHIRTRASKNKKPQENGDHDGSRELRLAASLAPLRSASDGVEEQEMKDLVLLGGSHTECVSARGVQGAGEDPLATPTAPKPVESLLCGARKETPEGRSPAPRTLGGTTEFCPHGNWSGVGAITPPHRRL